MEEGEHVVEQVEGDADMVVCLRQVYSVVVFAGLADLMAFVALKTQPFLHLFPPVARRLHRFANGHRGCRSPSDLTKGSLVRAGPCAAVAADTKNAA